MKREELEQVCRPLGIFILEATRPDSRNTYLYLGKWVKRPGDPPGRGINKRVYLCAAPKLAELSLTTLGEKLAELGRMVEDARRTPAPVADSAAQA